MPGTEKIEILKTTRETQQEERWERAMKIHNSAKSMRSWSSQGSLRVLEAYCFHPGSHYSLCRLGHCLGRQYSKTRDGNCGMWVYQGGGPYALKPQGQALLECSWEEDSVVMIQRKRWHQEGGQGAKESFTEREAQGSEVGREGGLSKRKMMVRRTVNSKMSIVSKLTPVTLTADRKGRHWAGQMPLCKHDVWHPRSVVF